MKIISVVGARPNLMKIAPLMKEFEKYPELDVKLVHTGQHYDFNMSDEFFANLNIREPDYNMGVGSDTHAAQTAKIMLEFEKVCIKEKPDLVIVVGDVNSTVACSLVAAKLGIKIAHVEAGLRSFNWDMPEEINRVLTDRLSDFLFTTSKDADKNLENEGIDKERVYFVGNVMIDTLLNFKTISENSEILNRLNLKQGEYAVLTMHRPSNVDNKETLSDMLDAMNSLDIKVVYPMHPRTKKMIERFGLNTKNIIITEPLGYLDFIKLMSNAKLVITDSGGIQEETTILGIPCLTIRGETERPITVEQGTNIVVGEGREKIIQEANKIIAGKAKKGSAPELWDGKAAERIVKTLVNSL